MRSYMEEVLTEREKTILILRYGLDRHKVCTQWELADLLGISRSYVSRLEKKALGKLRRAMEEDGT